jgi:hypothetical protein
MSLNLPYSLNEDPKHFQASLGTIILKGGQGTWRVFSPHQEGHLAGIVGGIACLFGWITEAPFNIVGVHPGACYIGQGGGIQAGWDASEVG